VVVAAVCLAGLCSWVSPGSSLASVTFGGDLALTPNVGIAHVNASTVFDTTPADGGGPVASPITGTLLRWRIRTGSSSSADTLRLRVLAPAGGGYTGAGTSAGVFAPTSAATTEFPTQLPIAAGDFIGIDTSALLDSYAMNVTGATLSTLSPQPADGGSPEAATTDANFELLVNADVAALPTSTATIPGCSPGGQIAVTVTPDPDPAVAAAAVHYRVDGGGEVVAATSGSPGVATVTLANGSHTLEYWGGDTVGGLERPHHTASVLVDTVNHCGPGPASRGPASRGPASPGPPLANAAVTRLGVHPSAFVAASSGGAIARQTGTTVSYNASQAATTTFTVQRPEAGVRKGRGCVKRGNRAHGGKRCTRYTNVGSFTHVDSAGANGFHFTGRVSRRTLRPGSYRLQAVARGATRKPGPPATTGFRVITG
jgi:hypothetical protein